MSLKNQRHDYYNIKKIRLIIFLVIFIYSSPTWGMDCKPYRANKTLTLGFKADSMLFTTKPDFFKFIGYESSKKWAKIIQDITATFQQLCMMQNADIISKKEYNKRISEADKLTADVMNIQKIIWQRKKDKKDSDRTIIGMIDHLNLQIEGMPPPIYKKTASSEDKNIKTDKVFISEGMIRLDDDSYIGQAKAMARNRAKVNSLEQAGVLISSSTAVYNNILISDLIRSTTKGLIVGQDLLFEEYKKEGKYINFNVLLLTIVRSVDHEKKGDFKILKAGLFKPDSTSLPESSVFQNNDEVQMRINVNKDAYINIFNVDQEGNVTKLLPNKYIMQEILPARTDLVFPDDELQEIGFKIRVKTPKNAKRAIESLIIIATKNKTEFLTGVNKGALITDLMIELSGFESSEWAEKTVGYEVRR